MIPEVKDLLDELTPNPDKVGTIKSSKMIITAGDRVIEFEAKDCERILQSPETVNSLVDVLGKKEDINVELFAVDLDDEVAEALERACTSVDEI
jgi:hypothetical protein